MQPEDSGSQGKQVLFLFPWTTFPGQTKSDDDGRTDGWMDGLDGMVTTACMREGRMMAAARLGF